MRRVPRYTLDTELHRCPNGASPPVDVWNSDYRGLLASEGHKRLRSGAWSGGGPLYVHRVLRHHGVPLPYSAKLNGIEWSGSPKGSLGVDNHKLVPPNPSVAAAFAEVDPFALKGWLRTRPGGKPLASGFVAGAETANDGLPSVPFWEPFGKKNKAGFPVNVPFREIPWRIWRYVRNIRYLGGQYLNVVFGWVPFIRDLRGIYSAMKNMNKAIARLILENGRGIHRRVKLLEERTSSQTRVLYPYPFANVYGAPPNYAQSGGTEYTVTTTTMKKVWYSAHYVYYIKDPGSWLWDLKARAILFGVLPTPGAIWAVTPWSWLFDWFSNMGDLYELASPTAVDQTVQKYQYTMMHDVTDVHSLSYVWQSARTGTAFGGTSVPRVDHAFSSHEIVERKLRGTGWNPFGPGSASDGLSAGQIAILAALGMSRFGPSKP